ncbi:MAG: DnaJ C-terminal domain-containing protein [Actinomycetes bacterium]
MAAKDLYEKDLYKILGVSKSADATAIKKAYRKLAKDFHPDKTKGDKKLEDRFKEVSEAYEVLSDDKKRAEYQEMREAFTSGRVPRGGQQTQSGGFSSGNFEDIFGGGSQNDIFSTLFGGGSRAPRKGQDLQTETTISFRDAIFGREISLRVNDQTITTRVPAGIKDGAKIKLKGRGAPSQAGPGDLFIIIHVTKHPVFTRDGNNLAMTLPVTFTEAALGADIAVPTLSGEDVTVRLAPGTQNGKVLRVKGRGITKDFQTGDLLITVEVQVPQRLDSKAKSSLEDFAELTKEDSPRINLKERAGA